MAGLAIVDYGMGNLHSIAKACERAGPGVRVTVTREAAVLARADRVVFPGVGAIRHCMAELERLELVEPLRRAAAEKPFLGICLGMQALLEHSEENEGVDTLGFFPGRVRRFPAGLAEAGRPLKIPHMGWNRVHQVPHPLWDGIAQDSWFYFVHSYYADPADPAHVTGRTEYGIEFASAIGRDNLFAVQFHPEKSQQAGLRLLANFMAWNP
ncbi:MAG: imidazole glycerol phosphate synthase subunit HisH [Gammaproteobacteria bacterium]|nr:MAG: imidazole glycerol phosphate synthase subunit HisH [Gammaproteobacteria bacterium]